MMGIKRLFQRIFEAKRGRVAPAVNPLFRGFSGATNNRLTNWLYSGLTGINADLRVDYTGLIGKIRYLVKNNPLVRSYLSNAVKNIIGKSGFRLQSLYVNSITKSLDQDINREIQGAWYTYNQPVNGFISPSENMRWGRFG